MEIEMKMEIEVEWLVKRTTTPTPRAKCKVLHSANSGGADATKRPTPNDTLNQILLVRDYESYGRRRDGQLRRGEAQPDPALLRLRHYDSCKNEPLSALKRDKAARLNIFNRKQLQNSGFSRIGRGAI